MKKIAILFSPKKPEPPNNESPSNSLLRPNFTSSFILRKSCHVAQKIQALQHPKTQEHRSNLRNQSLNPRSLHVLEPHKHPTLPRKSFTTPLNNLSTIYERARRMLLLVRSPELELWAMALAWAHYCFRQIGPQHPRTRLKRFGSEEFHLCRVRRQKHSS